MSSRRSRTSDLPPPTSYHSRKTTMEMTVDESRSSRTRPREFATPTSSSHHRPVYDRWSPARSLAMDSAVMANLMPTAITSSDASPHQPPHSFRNLHHPDSLTPPQLGSRRASSPNMSLMESTAALPVHHRGDRPPSSMHAALRRDHSDRILYECESNDEEQDQDVVEAQQSMRRLQQQQSESSGDSVKRNLPPATEAAPPTCPHKPVPLPASAVQPLESRRFLSNCNNLVLFHTGLELGVLTEKRRPMLDTNDHLVRCHCCRRYLGIVKSAMAVRCPACSHVSPATDHLSAS